ncbi:MAG: WecB/TagA/CpsF family glycosyltransferase [Defluviitaleaceae bacterium]|nr:WecB/TagA/CpsF family glycosyltransferase [Defluviitaleaceae bacterium]
MRTVEVLGVEFNAMSGDEAVGLLRAKLDAPRGKASFVVATPNPEALLRAKKDPVFMEALRGAGLRLPDGTGVVLASRLLGDAIGEKLGGFDVSAALFESIRGENKSVYLLGSVAGAAEKAKITIEEKFAGLRVAGTRDGYFKIEEEPGIVDEINGKEPDVLVLGMGMPKQETFAARNAASIKAPLTLCLGGTIDVYAGIKKRPPKIFIKTGFEWLGYLITGPRRFQRLTAIPRFAFAVICERLKGAGRGPE